MTADDYDGIEEAIDDPTDLYDPDDRECCPECEGTGDAGDILCKRPCPWCKGAGHV